MLILPVNGLGFEGQEVGVLTLRRILKTCLHLAGMSTMIDWLCLYSLWAIRLLFWLRCNPAPTCILLLRK